MGESTQSERSFRQRVLAGERLVGTFLNLGSPVSAEIAAKSGLDWVLLDTEHGMGGFETLLHQLIAVSGTEAFPMVRIPWLQIDYFKRVLDLGARGIMVPYVESAEQAREAVHFSRYPPHGVRGVAKLNRGAEFGRTFDENLAHGHTRCVVAAQIETGNGVEQSELIAAVDGIDVLFVGPLDLSVNLGVPQRWEDPTFLEAKRRVITAARSAGKAAGILMLSADQIGQAFEEGFSFVAGGSDGGAVAAAMRAVAGMKPPGE